MNLEQFSQNLGAIVRSNRFTVEIKPPSAFKNFDVDLETLKFNVKSAEIPSRSIGEYEFKYYGMSLRLPGDTNYDDCNITFINEDSWSVRSFFEDWQDMILESLDNKKEFSYNILYNSQLIINQHAASSDDILATYIFHSVYPKVVGQIELSMESVDVAQEFQVTFGYSYWERD